MSSITNINRQKIPFSNKYIYSNIKQYKKRVKNSLSTYYARKKTTLIKYIRLLQLKLNKNIQPKRKQPKISNYIDISTFTFPMKSSYNSVIPLNIFQTWHTRELPLYMKACVDSLKREHPNFTYQLFDDNDCREFIKNNFPGEVLGAFDSLIPGAYKADLWRYCVLYMKGGIYLDIKFKLLSKMNLIALTESEHFVNDVASSGGGVYNALLITKAKNPQLKIAIDNIVKNVKYRYYGINSLSPTGPLLLNRSFNSKPAVLFDIRFDMINRQPTLFYQNIPVFTSYDKYRDEQGKFQLTAHYSQLWNHRAIYA